VVVVESPGSDEVRDREPLVGRTGAELNAALLDYGLVREKLLLINGIACMPREPNTEADMKAAVVACSKLFWSYLEGVSHLPTLICGKWAHFAACGTLPKKGIASARGFIDTDYRLAPIHNGDGEVEAGGEEEGDADGE
jgi:uracil-DNA glycosylase family 4